MKRTPRVSIGMPIYNGAKSLQAALESVFSQSYDNLQLIISNNASTDDTEKIIKKNIKNRKDVKYYKQKKTIDPTKNFNFVFKKSQSKYFMWWAHDDVRSKDFINECVKKLEQNKKTVAVTCPFKFKGANNKNKLISYSLDGDIKNRLKMWFQHYKKCHGIFYSVIKKEILLDCPFLRKESFLAIDWAIILFLISRGTIQNTKKGFATFGVNGYSSHKDFMKKSRKRKIEYLLPYLQYSAYALKSFKLINLQGKANLIFHLCELNISTLILVCKQFTKSSLRRSAVLLKKLALKIIKTP